MSVAALIVTVMTAIFFVALLVGAPLKASMAGQGGLENLRPLLFADQPEAFLSGDDIRLLTQPDRTYEANDWRHLLAVAIASQRQGDTEAARKAFRQCLAIPELEPRVRLLAWSGLRRLGERPEPGAGREAQGIVFEAQGRYLQAEAFYRKALAAA